MALWQVDYTRNGEQMVMIYEGGHDLPELETVYETLVDHFQLPKIGCVNLLEVIKKNSIVVLDIREPDEE